MSKELKDLKLIEAVDYHFVDKDFLSKASDTIYEQDIFFINIEGDSIVIADASARRTPLG